MPKGRSGESGESNTTMDIWGGGAKVVTRREKKGTASGQCMNTVSDSTEDDGKETDAWVAIAARTDGRSRR